MKTNACSLGAPLCHLRRLTPPLRLERRKQGNPPSLPSSLPQSSKQKPRDRITIVCQQKSNNHLDAVRCVLNMTEYIIGLSTNTRRSGAKGDVALGCTDWKGNKVTKPPMRLKRSGFVWPIFRRDPARYLMLTCGYLMVLYGDTRGLSNSPPHQNVFTWLKAVVISHKLTTWAEQIGSPPSH